MPRPSNTDERRTQIAEALLAVMARRGYAGASIADIASAAGLTAGLVHYHFASKQEILLAALGLLAARHAATVEARLAAAGADPLAEIAAFLDVHLGLGADADADALACWILLAGEALRDRDVQAAYQEALLGSAQRLAAAIRRGARAGVLTCADPAAAAGALMAAIQGYVVLAAAAGAVVPAGSAAACSKRMADGLLQPVRSLAARPRKGRTSPPPRPAARRSSR